MARIDDLDEFLRTATAGLERPQPGTLPHWDWELRVAPDVCQALLDAAGRRAQDGLIMADGTVRKVTDFGLEDDQSGPPELGPCQVTVIAGLGYGRWELLRDGRIVRYGTLGHDLGAIEVR